MPVTPNQLLQRLEFYEQRAPVWVANAEAIGLSSQQSAVVQTLVDDCRTAYDAAQAARNAAKSATVTQEAAFEAMDTFGAQMIKIIRAFGIATDDAAVFATAQIPEPKEPEPIAPVNPSNVTFHLDANGALEIRWDGRTFAGTSYLVDRQTWTGAGQPTSFSRIATVTERRFVDTAVPAGTVTATYRVSALKGGQQTPGAQSTAHFVFVGNGPAQLVIPPEADAA
ncbi:MAG: hypothetical protein AAFV77_12955 [Planctomycetota bacterium]